MLLDLLNESTVEICSEVKNWEEAGWIAGKLLLDSGKIEERYIEAMIETVKKYGPYIVIAPRVALFHARPEDGVKSICISLIIVKKGVIFKTEKNNLVKLVFALGALDNESHLEALSEIVSLLQDNNTVDNLISANSKEEIIQIIKNKMVKD